MVFGSTLTLPTFVLFFLFAFLGSAHVLRLGVSDVRLGWVRLQLGLG